MKTFEDFKRFARDQGLEVFGHGVRFGEDRGAADEFHRDAEEAGFDVVSLYFTYGNQRRPRGPVRGWEVLWWDVDVE